MAERAPSVVSKASTSSRYHTVSRSSRVDESLFGSKGTQQRPAARGSCVAEAQKQPDVVTVSKTHLTRMMQGSPILTAAQVRERNAAAQAAKDKERAHSKARKDRMLALEEERKKQVPPTETELLRQQEDGRTLSTAAEKLAEQQDEVKAMNQMVLYSKCVTIRDAQLQERKHMLLEEEAQSRRLDTMMEVERVKALENYEARDRQRQAERLQGAQVLQEQLEERRRRRLREEEQQERERVVMAQEAERLHAEEMRAKVEKQLRAQQLIAEVVAANSEQVGRKKAMQSREVEEEARIMAYNRAKAAREAELQAERERVAAEKEREIARLRAAQEKAADKQSELHELRARRHAEAAEREWRAQEMAKAARDKAILEDLHDSRQAQQAAKVAQQAHMAAHEKAEFERILRVNQDKEAQEHTLAEQTEQLRKHHQGELLAQIAAREEGRKAERCQHLEAGKQSRKAAADYLGTIEAIKQKKLAELRDAGVPAKYCAELAKYKVGRSGH